MVIEKLHMWKIQVETMFKNQICDDVGGITENTFIYIYIIIFPLGTLA